MSARAAASLPGGRTLLLLGVGVVGVSLAAPLIASLAVPALAIAFWRNALATAVIAPVVATSRIRHGYRPSRRGRASAPGERESTVTGAGATQHLGRDAGLVVLAGLCLAAHFGFWVTSLDLTSVASSTAIVSLQVIWVVGYDLARGVAVGRQVLVGVLLSVAGAVVVGGVDFSLSARALAGDALALVGSVAVAAYAVIGGLVRQRLPTSTYTLGCYGTAASALLVAAVLAGQPLAGYPPADWVKLAVLTVAAQLLGHSVFNHLLVSVSPMVVSLAILLEIPGAALIAGVWLGQVPPAGAFAGLALVLGGMALVVVGAPASAGGEPAVA